MAKRILGLLVLGLSINTMAQTCMQFDKYADFKGYKTFSFEEEEIIQDGNKVSASTESDIIKQNLKANLEKKGLIQDNKNPDLLVSFIDEKVTDTIIEKVPPIPVSYGSGAWTDDGFTKLETSEALIINVKDTETNKTVWRAGKNLKVKSGRKQKKIYKKDIAKIMDSYPPKKM
jgi:hypothetical protein